MSLLDVEIVDAGRDDLGRLRAALVEDPVAGQVFQHVAVDAPFGCWCVVERQELFIDQPDEESDEWFDEGEVAAEGLSIHDKHIVGVEDVRVEVVPEVRVTGFLHLV